MDDIIEQQIRNKSVPLLYKRKEMDGDFQSSVNGSSNFLSETDYLDAMRNKFITIKVTR